MQEPDIDPLRSSLPAVARMRELLEQSRFYSEKMSALARELEELRDELHSIVAGRSLQGAFQLQSDSGAAANEENA